MPDDANEGVAEHSSRLQPSIYIQTNQTSAIYKQTKRLQNTTWKQLVAFNIRY